MEDFVEFQDQIRVTSVEFIKPIVSIGFASRKDLNNTKQPLF